MTTTTPSSGGPLANGDEASETTPLLVGAASAVAVPAQDPDAVDGLHALGSSKPEDKPLPVRQIMLLCYARAVEPIAFFSIFPYINFMIKLNGNLPDSDVGFYSGLIESLFSLTQMMVMMFWGRAADRLGRKPVLVFSLFGVTFATALFGLARTLWQMILFRCIAGVFAGTIVTIRTMVSEHSTAKTQARSFSWFAFSGNLGIFFGPLLGGALAEPAKQFPRLFGGIRFFEEYPYALPSFVVSAVGLSACVTTLLFVDETLKKQPKGSEGGDDGGSSGSRRRPGAMTTWELLKAPGVATVLYVYCHAMVLGFAYTAIAPVFWFTPIELGGVGFTPFQTSIFMGETGFSQAFWLLVLFPPLQHRLGTNGILRACGIAYPFSMGINVLISLLLRAQGGHTALSYTFIALFLLIMPGVSMAFTSVQLALNDVSPSPETLGTLNALALTSISALRSFNPALFTALFAVGARTQILHGYLTWLVLVIVAAGFTVATRFLPAASEKDWPNGDATGQEETDAA
ncbi:MFS general substrate transporter [Xylariales sp. PMI_506]|nr:MFS general substrate transporter [Xylariales sp. PMI_506]